MYLLWWLLQEWYTTSHSSRTWNVPDCDWFYEKLQTATQITQSQWHCCHLHIFYNHQLWIFAIILRINITGEVPITNLYNYIKMIKEQSHHIHVYKESEANALYTLNFSTRCMTNMCLIHRNDCWTCARATILPVIKPSDSYLEDGWLPPPPVWIRCQTEKSIPPTRKHSGQPAWNWSCYWVTLVHVKIQ